MTEREGGQSERAPDFETDEEVRVLLGLAELSRGFADDLLSCARAFNNYLFSLEWVEGNQTVEQDEKRQTLREALDKADSAWHAHYLAVLRQYNGVCKKDIKAWRSRLDRIFREQTGINAEVADIGHHASMSLLGSMEREYAREQAREDLRRADPKEQKRLKALLAEYERKKEVRAQAVEESEAEFEKLTASVARLPAPMVPGKPPAVEDLTEDEVRAQDEFTTSLERLHHLFFVFVHGIDKEFESDKDYEVGKRAAELTIGGMPLAWIQKQLEQFKPSVAEELESIGEGMFSEREIVWELIHDGYLTRENVDREQTIWDAQMKRLNELSEASHALHNEHLLRIIRKEPEDEQYRLVHRDDS